MMDALEAFANALFLPAGLLLILLGILLTVAGAVSLIVDAPEFRELSRAVCWFCLIQGIVLITQGGLFIASEVMA